MLLLCMVIVIYCCGFGRIDWLADVTGEGCKDIDRS